MDQKANAVEGGATLSTPHMSQDEIVPRRRDSPHIRSAFAGRRRP